MGQQNTDKLSEYLQRRDIELNVRVNLSRPLLITQIGSSGFVNGFVNNFTLLYGEDVSNTTAYVTSEWENGQVRFTDPRSASVLTAHA